MRLLVRLLALAGLSYILTVISVAVMADLDMIQKNQNAFIHFCIIYAFSMIALYK
tara:strand:+ start:973 stop:1137 length:165 start_codon:yes stop_codon:yes gene_type:complete